MKNTLILLLMIIAFSATSCKDNKKEEAIEQEDATQKEMVGAEKTEMQVVMEPKSETNTKGIITFTQEEGVVKMIGSFTGLQEGTHAIHLHEKADCTAADGTSSGGHWNPTFEQHGKWSDPSGYHKGDIGNFNADAQGNGEIAFKTDEWCIGCGDEKKDILGKAIIVHAGTDDYVTQPTGDAGGRISCGGIIQ